MATKRTPADLLKQMLGRPVSVQVNQDIVYRGTLICLDGQMNLCLQGAEEFEGGDSLAKHEQLFLRGNNVTFISTKHNL